MIIPFKMCKDYLQNDNSLPLWFVHSRKMQSKHYTTLKCSPAKTMSSSDCFNFLPNFLSAKDQARVNKRKRSKTGNIRRLVIFKLSLMFFTICKFRIEASRFFIPEMTLVCPLILHIKKLRGIEIRRLSVVLDLRISWLQAKMLCK